MKLARREKAHKFFEPAEIQALLGVADKPLKAMLLLGINCGLGNEDLNQLSIEDLDLDHGLLDMYRRKTGEERRAVLWSETVDAIREVLQQRPPPKDDRLNNRVFITTHGREWIRTDIKKAADGTTRMSRSDNVSQRFASLRKRADVTPNSRGFYSLRHTFRSVADAVPDRPAVDLCMGHESSADIRSHYVDPRAISVGRLQAVADHVHQWLWSQDETN